MKFKKQKKTFWFPSPKKSNKVKKGMFAGLGVGSILAMIFKPKRSR